MVEENERILIDGLYAELNLSYDSVIAQEKNGRPFGIDALRPIQMSRADVLDTLFEGRSKFEIPNDWIDFLLRSVGFEPAEFDERARRVALLRMVPFAERNYNLVELGPRGTGKSHLFQQISPYAHLISVGKATVARMFVNMASGQRGLVCQYDVRCFDEIAGVSFDSKDGVNISSIELVPNAVPVAELAIEKQAQTLLMPVSARRQLNELPDELWTKINVEFYSDVVDAVFKALEE
jgi:ATP-dependent Lon protease